MIQREFYRSARGPSPRDEDKWILIFDRTHGGLFVRHEWQAAGHSGVDDVPLAEFLEQDGAEQIALIADLFGIHTDAPARPHDRRASAASSSSASAI